jgi:hypothetical protein
MSPCPSKASAVHQSDEIPQPSSQPGLTPPTPDVTTFTPVDGLQVIPEVETRIDQGVMGQGARIG